MTSIQVILDPAPTVVEPNAVRRVEWLDVPTSVRDYARKRIMGPYAHGPRSLSWQTMAFATIGEDVRTYMARRSGRALEYGVQKEER